MSSTAEQKYKDLDFEGLETAVAKPDNSKHLIIDHINAYGAPGLGPDLQLFQNNGVVIKDDFASYLGNKDFYSTGSFAKLANGTPLDFHYDINEGVKEELEKYKDRSSFDLGSFVHEAILEPGKWETIVCEPQASRASHEGLDKLINFWEGQIPVEEFTTRILRPLDLPGLKPDQKKLYITALQEASGKRCIDDKNATIVKALHNRWLEYQNGIWANILDTAHKEVSIYCDDFRGLPMRVRPDGLLFSEQIGVNAIVSVKTTAAISVNKYVRDCRTYGYDLKEAAYRKVVSQVTGRDFDTTIMVVLSTTEPFHVGVFILNDNEMEGAFNVFSAAIETAKACLNHKWFPGWEIEAEANSIGIIDLNIY